MRTIASVLALATLAGAASAADPVFLTTTGSTLFRASSSGGVSSFPLSDDLVSMFTMPNGEIWGVSSTASVNGTFELYRLDGALSATPTLTLLHDGFQATYPGMSYANGFLYGFADGSQNFDRIDPTTFAVSGVGQTGTFSNGGAAYDAATDTFWGTSSNTNALYTIDYSLSGGPDPTGTLVGALGFDFQNHDAEFYNGVLYATVQRNDNGAYEAGILSTVDGSFTTLVTIEAVYTPGVVGMVVVPTPSTLALVAFGGLVAARRRR